MCGQTKTRRYPNRSLAWFLKWLHGQTFHSLIYPGLSHRTARRRLTQFLDIPPKPKPIPNPSCHMVIDATWFGRAHFLIVYWDTHYKYAQYWRYTTVKEGAEEITQDLLTLRQQGVILASVTSDGSPGIIKAVQATYPNIAHQRCLVHIQRQVLAWLSRNPLTQAGKDLRELALGLNQVNNHQDKDRFVGWFGHWRQHYETFLKQRSLIGIKSKHWQYTHRNLRKCQALIDRAAPDMWHYLDNDKITKDTNGLEGRFGVLKQHYKQHRGLSKTKRESYFHWYLTVCINRKNPTQNGH